MTNCIERVEKNGKSDLSSIDLEDYTRIKVAIHKEVDRLREEIFSLNKQGFKRQEVDEVLKREKE